MKEKRPWLPWYSSTRWQRIRKAQLAAEPLCQLCLEIDVVTEANTVDHVIPHRGNEQLFWSGPFNSLCASCHSRHKQRQEHGRTIVRFDASGWPR
ncbi:HNH endonuclease [Bosea sp. NPDC055332]